MFFFKQWFKLKEYCNTKGIEFIRDMPFFVGHESADVWAYPHFFMLDENKANAVVAGTPPDQISETGQLWGMPVYNWDNLKKENFSWWLNRINKNLELYTVLRLDHFRAFAACWAVPATDKTAEN